MVKEILKLGNPQLYEVSEPITKDEAEDVKVWVRDLHDTLMHMVDRRSGTEDRSGQDSLRMHVCVTV